MLPTEKLPVSVMASSCWLAVAFSSGSGDTTVSVPAPGSLGSVPDDWMGTYVYDCSRQRPNQI